VRFWKLNEDISWCALIWRWYKGYYIIWYLIISLWSFSFHPSGGSKTIAERPATAQPEKTSKSAHSTQRYLNENRVGSLETSPVQGSLAGHSSAEDSPEVMRRSYENFQRNEAFNPHNNYHRNKLLTQKTGRGVSAEAINNEMIRNLQPSDKSDTASVGSFLSMASVRAFPKSTHPEPLNRVLDPVFVTYYDNVNAVEAQQLCSWWVLLNALYAVNTPFPYRQQ